jgi:peptidoglycan/xylan/chitin deacetylase (PgdA/CDA1 family)
MTERSAVQWPNGARSCVALAFDLDGPTGGAMLDGSIWGNPSFFTLGSYGPWRALPRLLDLLARFRLPATFFVPAWVVETWPERCRAIVDQGHEIAYHGDRHESFWELDEAQQRTVMERSRAVFKQHLGIEAVGFRTPSGDWGPATTRVLAESGVIYSSSMRGDDRPYFIEVGRTDDTHDIDDAGGEQRRLVEIPGRWEFDDYAYFAFHRAPNFPVGLDRIASYETTLDNWRREFDGSRRDGLCLTTLFHPKVSGKPGRLLVLERLFEHMRAHEDVWFATCAEVARWWLATGGGADAPEAAPAGRA